MRHHPGPACPDDDASTPESLDRHGDGQLGISAFDDDLLGRADELKDTGLSLDDVLEDIERGQLPPDDDDQP